MSLELATRIQDAVVDSSSSLSQTLLLCKVLAAQLKSQAFGTWLVHETEGYPEGAEVPSYRKLQLEIRGHFSGPFGSGMRHAPIPIRYFPEQYRDLLKNFPITQSIASIEHLIQSDNEATAPQISLSDLQHLLHNKVFNSMGCVQCWGIVPQANLVDITNNVRNKLLDLVLSLGITRESSPVQVSGVDPGAVSDRVVNNIYGGSFTNFVTGQSHFAQITVREGNIESLLSSLEQLDLSAIDIQSLTAAIRSDPKPAGQAFGPGVAGWIGSLSQKAASGTLKLGATVATELAITALKKYYGLTE